jgi:hypothetical protein
VEAEAENFLVKAQLAIQVSYIEVDSSNAGVRVDRLA